MTFTVIWKHSTVDRLTAYYVSALESGEDSSAITASVAQIDALLAANPLEQGESRQKQERILIVPPLVVDFEVFDQEKVVLVFGIRYFFRK
jgi:hypothetical protein